MSFPQLLSEPGGLNRSVEGESARRAGSSPLQTCAGLKEPRHPFDDLASLGNALQPTDLRRSAEVVGLVRVTRDGATSVMRNLSTLWTASAALPESHSSHRIAASAFDVDEGVLYLVSELVRDSDVEFAVWRTIDDGVLSHVTSTSCPAAPDSSPQLILAVVFPDTRDLCLISRTGDIVLVPLSPDVQDPPSTLGTVSPGVHAASLSPDASLLALVSAAPTPLLILMHAPGLTIITEGPLHTASPGAAQPVTAGWGSKATQFHGSLGKQAAHASAPDRSTSSPDDDGAPRISWRGDAQFFAVSAREDSSTRRVLRVYDRQGVLQNTAEDVPGLEHPLAWRPSGALIACTQRFGAVPRAEGGQWALGQGRDGRHDVVFFERNGLRHGEFTLREPVHAGTVADAKLPWGYRVRELAWNADSSVLAVWVEYGTSDVVQLWTTGNYHWYLKLVLPSPPADHITNLTWHPEDAARLILTFSHTVRDIRLTRHIAVSSLSPPNDTGLVSVVDGNRLLLTPFRTQNVPPPMAAQHLTLPASSPPTHVAFSPTPPSAQTPADTMALLFPGGAVAVWEVSAMPHAVAPREAWRGEIDAGAREIAVRGRCAAGARCVVAVVCLSRQDRNEGAGGAVDVDVVRGVVFQDGGAEGARWEVAMPGARGRLVDVYHSSLVGNEEAAEEEADEVWVWQGNDGRLWEFSRETAPRCVASFPEFCAASTRVTLTPSFALFIGIAGSTLYAATATATSSSSSTPSPPLSKSCTSYTPAGSFLIYTTTSPTHAIVFLPLASFLPPASGATSTTTAVSARAEERKIERGARIVAAVPSTMSVVLQMPRGNLETITPRPLVLARLREHVARGEYGVAFRAARKHRVDTNMLVETDPARFERSIGDVVTQLDDVEFLNLFLANLGRSSQPQETIVRLCDAIRAELEARDVRRYVHAILTAHVVKTPPDHEGALRLLVRLREEGDAALVEDAVKYVIFLADADRLFDTALGMYDFGLVLLVAQYSQKDPREYLPVLRSLRALEGTYQRFAIDDHLGRRSKALQSLRKVCAEEEDAASAQERFEQAKQYVVRWSLYEEAVRLWEGEGGPGYEAMVELYGDDLFERREFGQAAVAFVEANRLRKAMVAYERALEWQGLFDLMLQEEGIENSEVVTTARRVADDLGSKRRYSEAARVLLDYADDVEEAVSALVRGGEWSEARRVTTLRNQKHLLDSHIKPGTLESRASLSEEISEINELRTKQVAQLDELAAKKVEEPEAFYGVVEDGHMENVDVMTDVSNPDTTFTRYTVAPSTSTNRSKRTSRSKRKLERKAGRKGTVEEEEYLLKSLAKLVGRFDAVLVETRALLPQLLMFGGEHAAEGRSLQGEVGALEGALRRDVERIWDERTQAQAQSPQVLSLPPAPNDPVVPLVEKVLRPVFSDIPWRIKWVSSNVVP